MSEEVNVRVGVDFEGNLTQLQNSITNFKSEFDKFNLGQGMTREIGNAFDKLEREMEKLKTIGSKEQINIIDQKQAEKSKQIISDVLSLLTKKSSRLSDNQLISKEDLQNIKQAKQNLTSYIDTTKSYNDLLKKQSDLSRQLAGLQKKREDLQGKSPKEQLDDATARLANLRKTTNFNRQKYGSIEEASADKTYNTAAIEKYRNAQREVLDLMVKFTEAQESGTQNEPIIKKAEEYKQLGQQIETVKTELTGIGNALREAGEGAGTVTIEGLAKALTSAGLTAEQVKAALQDIDPSRLSIDEIGEKIQSQLANKGDVARQSLVNMGNQATSALKPVAAQLDQTGSALSQLTDRKRDLDQFTSRLTYFFSISSMVNLFRRSVRQAVSAIKELDAVMTEMAVVTDLNVSDYWEQLPEYTERANALGVAIKDVYSAATLYYQQGLKTAEVNQLVTATLKMARIAGLDAEEATERMTNALRGFNMELSETSAIRVADVYSNLAAKSASNTDEISTAMTKVASLAHNAGMEFETTAAFLSQIIETTRESAETAGTALKTVVARFSEVKKLYSTEGLQGSGNDEEGDEIHVNKVSEALASAGISLNDYLTGAKGLDDIFIELASKWDKLDKVQQRYIATMAAGSRQQSRFIAMMSNYQRTLQLVDTAENSAGASQEQFGKTLEGLDAKLEQLHNAWNTFLLGIAESDTVKGIVTAITTVLNLINKILSALGRFPRAIASIGLAYAGLKLGKGVLAGGMNWFEKTKMGQPTAGAFKEGFTKTFKSNQGLSDAQRQALETEKAQLQHTQRVENGYATHRGWSEETRAPHAAKRDAAAQREAEIDQQLNQPEAQKSENFLQKKLSSWKGTMAGFAILVGQVISGVAAALQKNKIGDRVKDLSEGLEGFGNSASLAGAAFLLLPTPIAIVAGAVAGLVGVFKLFEGIIEDDEEKLERFTSNQKQSADAAKEAQNEYEKLTTSLDDLSTKYEELNKKAKFSNEWRNSINEINSAVLDLLEQYPELREFAKYINGTWTVSEAAVNQVKSDAIIRSQNAQISRIAADQLLDDQKWKMRWEGYELNQDVPALGTEVANITELIQERIEEGLTKTDLWKYDWKSYMQNQSLSDAEVKKFIESAYDELLSVYESRPGQTNTRLGVQTLLGQMGYEGANLEAITSAIMNGFEKVDVNFSEDAEEQYKEEFAKIYGYNLVDGEFKDADNNTIDEDQWKEQFDLYKKIRSLQRENNDEVKKANDALKEFDKTLKGGATALLKFADGAGVTKEQLDKLKELTGEDRQNFIESFFGGDEGAFEKVLDSASNMWNDIGKGITRYFNTSFASQLSSFISTNNLSAEQAKGLQNSLLNVQSQGGDASQFFDFVNNIYKNADEKNRDAVADLLFNENNWGTDSAITATIASLKKLGINISETTPQIIEMAGAIATVNIEKLNESLNDTKDIVDKVKSSLQEGKNLFDKDIIDSFTKQLGSGFVAENFIATDIGEYVFTGEPLDLLKSLDAHVAEILEQENGKLDEQIKRGEKINSVFQTDDGEIDELLLGRVRNMAAGSVYSDRIQQQVTDRAAEIFSPKELAGLTVPAIAEKLLHEWDTYGGEALVENQSKKDILGLTSAQLSQTRTFGTPQGMVNIGEGVINEDQRGQAANYLESEASAIANYNERFGELKASTDVANTAINALIITESKFEKKLSDVSKKIRDSEDALNDSTKSTDEYKAAIEDIAQEMTNALGGAVRVTADMISENIQAWEDYANGVEGSENRIRDILIQNSFADLMGEDFDLAKSALNDFINSDYTLKIGADPTELFNTLFEVLRKQTETAEEAAELAQKTMAQWGYSITFVPTYGKDPITGQPVIESVKPIVSDSLARTRSSNSASKKSGGSDKPKTWKNEIDRFHNLEEDLSEAQRGESRVQERINLLTRQQLSNIQDIVKERQKELQYMRDEYETQKQLAAARKAELLTASQELYVDENGKASSYASWGVDKYVRWDDTQSELLIDWDKINTEGMSNEDQYKAIKAYMDLMKDKAQAYESAADAAVANLNKIEDKMRDSAEEYIQFEKDIAQVFIDAEERRLEELTQISDGVNDSQGKILSAMQESINLQRQIRDNTQTEQNLSEQRARLAYLQRDTSGANQVEILQLQKQLNESEQNYTDQLVDQKLQDLQTEAQKAYEQRQQQIEIESQIHQYLINNGWYNEVANAIINATYNGDPWANYIKQITDLPAGLAESLGDESKGLGKLIKDADGNVTTLLTQTSTEYSSLSNYAQQIEGKLTDAEVKKSLSNAGLVNDWLNGKNLPGLAQNTELQAIDKTITDECKKIINAINGRPAAVGSSSGGSGSPGGPEIPSTNLASSSIMALQGQLNDYGWKDKNHNKLTVDGGYGSLTKSALSKVLATALESNLITQSDSSLPNTIDDNYLKWISNIMKKLKDMNIQAYATGGLADFTGPAWLDGTKSHPELVLSARDTENFLQLRDILSSALKGSTTYNNTGGTTNIEVNIDAEIANDYDVDQLAARVKRDIYQDAQYRNNTVLGFSR